MADIRWLIVLVYGLFVLCCLFEEAACFEQKASCFEQKASTSMSVLVVSCVNGNPVVYVSH